MNNFNYFRDEAIKQAKNIYDKLESHNKMLREAKENINAGSPTWEIRTPIYDPINTENQVNAITLCRKLIEDSNLNIIPVDTVSKSVAAHFEQYTISDSQYTYDITLTKHNYCLTRFYLCKELLHIFLHTPESSTTEHLELVKLIAFLIDTYISIDDKDCQTRVDHAAYFGAIELLIPSTLVPALIKARNDIDNDGELTDSGNLEIARKLGVPEYIVEFRLSEVGQEIYNSALS